VGAYHAGLGLSVTAVVREPPMVLSVSGVCCACASGGRRGYGGGGDVSAVEGSLSLRPSGDFFSGFMMWRFRVLTGAAGGGGWFGILGPRRG